MFGADLLVAPVVRAVERERGVYLPKGTEWYDFWTGRKYEGGQGIQVPVTLESIPVFARAGAFVFQQPVVQNTDQMRGLPLLVTVFPSAKSEAVLYEDDGHTLEYQKGNFSKRRFTQTRNVNEPVAVAIEMAPADGPYRPDARSIVLTVHGIANARNVSIHTGPLDGFKLEERPTLRVHRIDDRAEFARQATGWTVDENGAVRVKFPDDVGRITVTIDR
jgi:alpha-glucosidase (family GH31 glycosyl hydrolase)